MPNLTDSAVKGAKPSTKARKLFDTKGLYLEITPTGNKHWRFRYRFSGKEKRLSLGPYPEVTLRDARDERDKLRKILRDGVDPSQQRKLQMLADEESAEKSFAELTELWKKKVSRKLSTTSLGRDMRLLNNDIIPLIGPRAAADINPPELLRALQAIEKRGAIYTAHRARVLCGRIFRYGISIGWVTRDIAADLRDALQDHKETHQAAVTTAEDLAPILIAAYGYGGTFVVQCALKLAPMLMVRPRELRRAEWSEIDLEEAMWRIPGSKMKLRKDHLVPLPTQAVAILEELKELTGHRQWVFPGGRTPRRPLSENALTAALRSMHIGGDVQTWHGFRATASTLLHEMGWNPDVIEVAQARSIPGVRGTYNRAIYLKERKQMLQEWADYLDQLRNKHG